MDKNYAVTREQKRYIARQHMEAEKAAGTIPKHYAKHSYTRGIKGGDTVRHSSYFAEHWKEYVDEKEEKETG
jgi:hypothetical protein